MERPNAWKSYQEEDHKKVFEIGEEYKDLLSRCKTEREWTDEIVRRLESAGYISLDEAIMQNRSLKPGDKIYQSRILISLISE